ncbi:MAG: UDP-N-acetylglucosamine 2-epimerase [Bacteroidota bacterium]
MKLFVITSSRADYGLLRPLLLRIKGDNFFDLKIIATGSHLSKDFGYTYKEITNDKFHIFKKIDIVQSHDRPVDIANSSAIAIKSFGQLYAKHKPDAIFVLGDRYEVFCSVFAALFFKIPVIHYSGGEKTIGAYDDSIRHSITKMSHLHFVSCLDYRKRVIQLGENPKHVFNVGSLGIDNIKNLKLFSKSELEQSLNLKLSKPTFLVSYYPETLSKLTAKQQFQQVLEALSFFENHQIIFTKSNADNDGRIISKMIDQFVQINLNAFAFESLGVVRYLSAIKHVELVIGNSSSGYTEVPSFNVPTINIGNRQKGRVKAQSIIDVEIDAFKIKAGIITALKKEFRNKLKNHKSPFGYGDSSLQIIKRIKRFNFDDVIQKEFNDQV